MTAVTIIFPDRAPLHAWQQLQVALEQIAGDYDWQIQRKGLDFKLVEVSRHGSEVVPLFKQMGLRQPHFPTPPEAA